MNIKLRKKGSAWVAEIPTGERLPNGKPKYTQVRGATKSEVHKKIAEKIVQVATAPQLPSQLLKFMMYLQNWDWLRKRRLIT